MWTERVRKCGEVSISGAVGPASGPPMVLLHGVTRRWQDFLTLMPALVGRWDIHSLDLRGHGGSGRCPDRYRVIDYVDDIVSYLQTLVAEPAVIYGHSLGAVVAAAVAARLPGRVRAVVLEDPPAVGPVREIRKTPFFALFSGLRELACSGLLVPEISQRMAELRLPGADGNSTVRLGDVRDATSLRFSARCLQDLDPEVLTPLLEGIWFDGYNLEEIMHGVRCPALLLRADESCGGMLPRRDADQIVGWIGDCTCIDLPGTGHLIHWLEAEKTIRFVVGFLESLR